MSDDTNPAERPKPKVFQGSIGEFLRQIPGIQDDALRTRLTRMAGDSILGGSELAKWIEAGDLSDETLPLLQAALELRHLGHPAAWWTRLRHHLEHAATVVAAEDPGRGILLDEDPDREAFRAVDARLTKLEAAARRADVTITESGMRWNSEHGHLETRTGKRPRTFLRDLARGAVCARWKATRETDNSPEFRSLLARELSPFFPPDMLDTSKGSTFYNAIDAAIRNL